MVQWASVSISMRRQWLNLAAAFSLALLLAVIAVWVQSYKAAFGIAHSEVVAARKWGRTDAFGFDSGRFIFWTSDAHTSGDTWDMAPQWCRIDHRMLRLSFSPGATEMFGVTWESGRFINALAPTDFFRQLVIPCWFGAIIFSLLPLMWCRNRYLRWRSPRAGCCAQCGYDLRVTPNRCPECGALPKLLLACLMIGLMIVGCNKPSTRVVPVQAANPTTSPAVSSARLQSAANIRRIQQAMLAYAASHPVTKPANPATHP